jgi:hypothetical protein
LSPNAGLSERIRVYEEQHKIREQVREVFAQALTSQAAAQRTDLFAVLGVLPTSLRESRFLMAYSHSYQRN